VAGRTAVAVALLAAAVLPAACTGVPRFGTPEIVQSVGVEEPQQPVVTPQDGLDPRGIVQGFLTNNASNDEHHSAARAFLTPEEKSRWSDTSGAVIVDHVQIGVFTDDTVTISGHQIGSLDGTGAYKPSFPGDGTGGGGYPFQEPIGLKKIDGQWRIDTPLQQGLVLTATQFAQNYGAPKSIYFLDQSEQRLVPAPRYTSLTDPGLLANWLMSQLIVQPSSLSSALPSVPTGSPVKVSTDGQVIVVDLPGASQLATATKNLMAAQVALTLDQADHNARMRITDGGQPVVIPQIGSATFDADQFRAEYIPAPRSPNLYYVNAGAVYDDAAKPMPGSLGTASNNLTSVALATSSSSSRLLVAGTTGSSSDARLLVGQAGAALHTTSVQGELSRPAWAPDLDEVWIGDGGVLYRLNDQGRAARVPISASTGPVSGRIMSVRFSPEGARVSLVIARPGGRGQLWIGTIARAPTSVSVAGLVQISPNGVSVSDAAWNDQSLLMAVGHDVNTGDPSVYEVHADGSLWTPLGIGNLPPGLDSITVAPGTVAAVSAGGTVWIQSNGTWASLGSGTTNGTNPVYVE
jgi:hypothetical protein